MGQEICSYCSGSGRDAINPTNQDCWKCHGTGTYWVPDPVRSDISDSFSSDGGAARRRTSQYQMLSWMEKIFDSIPRWLNLLLAVICSGVGVALAQAMGSSSHGSMAVFAVGGFFLGLVSLRLSVVIVDLIIQFTAGLVKITIVLAIFGGIVYAVLKWTGAL